MTRLGLSLIAIALFAAPAMAADCEIDNDPTGCTVTDAYVKALEAAETLARANADTALQTNIDNEATTRANADTALGGRIDTEAAASQARDDALGKRIDKNSAAIEDAIALSAAIPDSWLSDSENFALALGGGFTDGSSAFGGIGTFRINKNLSAYGGGSTLTDGGTWAAKGGVRLGW